MIYYQRCKNECREMIEVKNFLGLILGLLATASWGSFYIAGRWLFGEEGENINIYLFSFLRFFMAVLVLSVILFHRQSREEICRAVKEDWKPFLLIAAIGIVAESFLVSYALNFTTAARCSLLANFSPVATVILAFLLLGEKTSKIGILGMLAGFAGLILAGSSRGGDVYAATSMRSLIGDVMALGSSFCWAFFTVYGVKVSGKYSGMVCMFVGFAIGTVLMSPVLFFTSFAEVVQIPPRVWGGMFYTGVVTLAFANACWYGALRYLKPGMLGAFGYLSAAITFTLSVILLKEKFTLQFIISVMLILGGMAVLMYSKRPEKEQGIN